MSLCLREHALEVKLPKYFHFAEKREKQRLILAAKSVGSQNVAHTSQPEKH